jgi:hypothetical protein
VPEGDGDPCAGPLDITFESLPGASVGARVHLVRDAGRFVLIGAGARVGLVADAALGDLAGCLEAWQYAGTITALQGAQGTAALAGTRLR